MTSPLCHCAAFEPCDRISYEITIESAGNQSYQIAQGSYSIASHSGSTNSNPFKIKCKQEFVISWLSEVETFNLRDPDEEGQISLLIRISFPVNNNFWPFESYPIAFLMIGSHVTKANHANQFPSKNRKIIGTQEAFERMRSWWQKIFQTVCTFSPETELQSRSKISAFEP
jgi:hypothetical protein